MKDVVHNVSIVPGEVVDEASIKLVSVLNMNSRYSTLFALSSYLIMKL